MEKRKHMRIAMKTLSVDAYDGIGFFSGGVSDVSSLGLCLTDLPNHLKEHKKILTIVVSAREEHFKMTVMAKWSIKGGVRKSVGVKIINAPWEWTEFIMQFDPVSLDH